MASYVVYIFHTNLRNAVPPGLSPSLATPEWSCSLECVKGLAKYLVHHADPGATTQSPTQDCASSLYWLRAV